MALPISADRALDLLRALERHPACARALLTYAPVTPAELVAMDEDQRVVRSAAATTAVEATPDWRGAREIVGALGRSRFAPAVDLLARVWRHSLILPLRTAAGHALFEIGSPDAHAALQAALKDADPHGDLPTYLALKSIVATTPSAVFDKVARFFEDDALEARFVAAKALSFFGPQTEGSEGRTWALPFIPELLRTDRRWVRTAVRFRRDARLGGAARALLSSLTRDEIDAALVESRDPPSPPPRIYVGPRDLVARYQRGETDSVWRTLREAGSVVDPALREEALAVATAAMRRVRANVERITERLRTADYPFDGDRPPWAAPATTTHEDIARIERAVGGPVPLTLRAFWTAVGSVYWKFTGSGDVSDTWRGLALREADPLCIDGAATAWWCIAEWEDEVASSHLEAVGPALLQLAPDYLHKANISGGMPYGFTVPNGEVDAVFEYEAHALPFVDYLRLCFRWGGFPRLERAEFGADGRQTLDELRRDLEPF